MIERDRKIIDGLRRIQGLYVRICRVLADRDDTTDDPIGAALTDAELRALRWDLQVTAAAIERRLTGAAEVVDGQVIVGEVEDGGGQGATSASR